MVGDTLGSYRVLRQIGTGGMGTVYYAQHQLIGRRAAIKILLPAISHEPEMVSRFFNEARATTQIAHPGLVEVIDFGYHTTGAAYIVMEYLEGETLMARVKREGRLQVWLAAVIVRQMASAVGAAHLSGIIHRDLKPENIFLVPERSAMAGLRVKVLDFGVAKLSVQAMSGGPSVHTRAGTMLGTPQYMSPEQCRGAGLVDHRSDIYAIGCILYELLTGKKVFVAQGLGELLAAHQRLPPPRLAQTDPSLPVELDGLLQRMLAKRPEDRPQSLEEVELTLEHMAAAHGWDAMWTRTPSSVPNMPSRMFQSSPGMPPMVPKHGQGPQSVHRGVPSTMGGAAAEVQRKPRRGGTVLMFTGAVVLVALGAGGTYFLTRGQGIQTEAAPGAQPAVAPPPAMPTTAASAPAAAPAPAAAVAAPPAAAAPDAAAAIVLVAASLEPPAAAAATVDAAAPAQAPPPTPDATTVPAKVKLRIDSEPPGADVYRGEERIGTTPLELSQPSAEGEVRFVLSFPGHSQSEVTLPTDRDGEARVVLDKKGQPPEAKPAQPPAGKPVRLKKPRLPAVDL